MTAVFAFAVEGLSALSEFDEVPDQIRLAALRAVNKTAQRARTLSARAIRQQVALPARYLSSADGRLEISKRATRNELESVVSAERRPTSLARFVRGHQRKRGVRVTVKPGAARYLRNAFLVKLRNNNVGLAVRTSGGPPRAAYKPRMIFPNVYLLYGPSVDQAFQTVRQDVSDETADFLEYEFNRLIDAEIA
jgi:hypothetical protein